MSKDDGGMDLGSRQVAESTAAGGVQLFWGAGDSAPAGPADGTTNPSPAATDAPAASGAEGADAPSSEAVQKEQAICLAHWADGAAPASESPESPQCEPLAYDSLDQMLLDWVAAKHRLAAPRSYSERERDEQLMAVLPDEIRSWVTGFDIELSTSLPRIQTELARSLRAQDTPSRQMEVLSVNATDLGGGASTPRYLEARVRVRRVHYSIMPMVDTSVEVLNLGAFTPNGEPYRSEPGLIREDPISDALAIIGVLGLVRALAARLVRAIASRLAARVGNGLPRMFGTPTVTGSGTLPAGRGWTDKFGNIRYSTAGTPTEQALAKNHELVHSLLSPKLNFLRTFRADFRMYAYARSHLVRYLEEALAETYAQLRVNGLPGLPDGIVFPIANGYVKLSRVLGEGLIGTVAFGSTAYGVHLILEEREP